MHSQDENRLSTESYATAPEESAAQPGDGRHSEHRMTEISLYNLVRSCTFNTQVTKAELIGRTKLISEIVG